MLLGRSLREWEGMLVVTRRRYNKISFHDRHDRVTIYIEKEVNKELQYRREQGILTNMTEFINSLLKASLGLADSNSED